MVNIGYLYDIVLLINSLVNYKALVMDMMSKHKCFNSIIWNLFFKWKHDFNLIRNQTYLSSSEFYVYYLLKYLKF